MMNEPRATAVTIQQESSRVRALGAIQTVSQATNLALNRAGIWARDTALQFGTMVAVLMAPAVFSAYAFAAWALACNLGWTDTFVFSTGALSNWIIWLGVAILVNAAAMVLKKHTNTDQ